ncbi:Uncharacterized protein BBAD15_g9681 [Beauveria bassiana D1-5]|uniref:Uncharacterized protein n=1 Tax=Beauveria bassiana D1-5 TaxID=1245745 RepID=A0A0A2VAZ0_BEABA|nr:Uncharacterized protein BBAD15_g9681 [Beauveria bassiana D1-5]
MSFKVMVRVGVPLVLGSAGYAASRIDWKTAVRTFLTGPGRTSRVLLLVFVLFNMKNMPFVWTSNSTYFADLDSSRTQLVSYLCRAGLAKLSSNPRVQIVLDPTTGRAAAGTLGIMLGSVSCSFKREIGAYRSYEMWSRILCWDRKWAYIVTHFVPTGTEWLDPGFAGYRVRRGTDASGGWETKIHATAISKYVFKLGRLTVHPAVVFEASGLLPTRPGGWVSGENQLGDESVDLSHVDLEADGEWTWQRVEASRRQGMETAHHVQELESLHDTFDGGTNGAIAVY